MDPRYFKHITAEAEDADGNFVRLRPDNHWLDCESMQQGLISRELHGGIDSVSRRGQAQAQPTPQKPAEPTENPYTTGRNSGTGKINPYTGR
jgi:hypothetical protein